MGKEGQSLRGTSHLVISKSRLPDKRLVGNSIVHGGLATPSSYTFVQKSTDFLHVDTPSRTRRSHRVGVIGTVPSDGPASARAFFGDGSARKVAQTQDLGRAARPWKQIGPASLPGDRRRGDDEGGLVNGIRGIRDRP